MVTDLSKKIIRVIAEEKYRIHIMQVMNKTHASNSKLNLSGG